VLIDSEIEVSYRIGHLMKVAVRVYNTLFKTKIKAVSNKTRVVFPCTVKGFLSGSYSMYGADQADNQVIMDINSMFPFMSPYLPSGLTKYHDFTDWLSEPYQMEGFAEMLVYTLPGDRSSFYQTSSMAKMRRNVFD